MTILHTQLFKHLLLEITQQDILNIRVEYKFEKQISISRLLNEYDKVCPSLNQARRLRAPLLENHQAQEDAMVSERMRTEHLHGASRCDGDSGRRSMTAPYMQRSALLSRLDL